MPNHVHLLVEMWQTPLSKLLHSWKILTSKRANALLDRCGQLWQEDYRDRYMRDEEHYRKTVRYIENNPVKAGLVKSPEQWRLGSSWWRLRGAEQQERGCPHPREPLGGRNARMWASALLAAFHRARSLALT